MTIEKNTASRKDHEIVNLKHLPVINSENGDVYWSPNDYISGKKQSEKVLSHITRKLESKLNSHHKESIEYLVISKLHREENEISLCINMYYYADSDLDINLLIEESKSLVSKLLHSIKSISEAKNIDINNLKIQEHSENENSITIVDDVAHVEKGLKNTLYSILEDLNSSNEISCSIGDESLNLTLPKSNFEIIESDEIEFSIGRITGVIERETVARVISENKKEEKYSYDKNIQEDLIRAQLEKEILKLEIRKSYRMSRGSMKPFGGTIIGCKESTENQQPELF
jgi:hypothetical protein